MKKPDKMQVHPRTEIKIVVLLAIIMSLAAGCIFITPTAPAIKRVDNYTLINEHYLTDVYIPSTQDLASRVVLSNAAAFLIENVSECRAILKQVEIGKIKVKQGIKGDWSSNVKKDGCWIGLNYSSRTGNVSEYQKHKNKNPYPLVYGFTFYPNGFISHADTINEHFYFDEQGRITSYSHPYFDKQGKVTSYSHPP